MAESGKASGKACGCNIFSCLMGCLSGILLSAAVPLVGVVAAYYYLPSYIEDRMIPEEMPDSQRLALNKPNQAALERLAEKLELFSKASIAGEPVDVTLVLSEEELNAWLAEQLLGPKAVAPLENAALKLGDGTVRLQVLAKGAALAQYIPDDGPAGYIKALVARARYIQVDAVCGVRVENKTLTASVQELRLAGHNIPRMVVDGIMQSLTGGRELSLSGLTVSEFQIKDSRVILRGIRGKLR